MESRGQRLTYPLNRKKIRFVTICSGLALNTISPCPTRFSLEGGQVIQTSVQRGFIRAELYTMTEFPEYKNEAGL